MKKALLIGAAAVGAVELVRRFARRCGEIDLESVIERMPENAPPKWMFRNISAIRQDTERIRALLEQEDEHARRAA